MLEGTHLVRPIQSSSHIILPDLFFPFFGVLWWLKPRAHPSEKRRVTESPALISRATVEMLTPHGSAPVFQAILAVLFTAQVIRKRLVLEKVGPRRHLS